MKKGLFVIAVLALFVLAACATEQSTTADNMHDEEMMHDNVSAEDVMAHEDTMTDENVSMHDDMMDDNASVHDVMNGTH